MQKIIFYSLALFLLLFFGFQLTKSLDIQKDHSGLFYISIDKKEAVINPQQYDIFIIKNKDQSLDIYKAFDYYSAGEKYAHSHLKNANRKNNDLFPLIYQDKINYTDTLKEVDVLKRKSIVQNSNAFEARRYSSQQDEPNDWFSRLDNSVFIFFFLSILPFTLLIFHDIILQWMQIRHYSLQYFLIQVSFIVLAIGFFFSMLNPENYSSNPFTKLLLLILVFGMVYLIFQFGKSKLKNWESSWKWKEGYKFVLLFSVSIMAIYLANQICILVDSKIFNSDEYTILSHRGRIGLEIGFAFSFALANFLNNLRRKFFKISAQNKNLKNIEGKALASEAELQAIHASVNPHFLYNSLNSIASLAKIDPEKTEAMAIALSNFYKYNTNRDGEHITSISDEIEMIENYLNIEKIRFGNRLQYRIDVDKNALKKKIPHFILQPLVENAIKYGYDEKKEIVSIQLEIIQKNTSLVITIFDSGQPFTDNLASGYGLKSVMIKLKLLFPDRHTINFINEPKKQVLIEIRN